MANIKDLLMVVEREKIKLPNDFWDFWSYYFKNPQLQGDIQRNFPYYIEYLRLWNRIVELARKLK